MQLDPQIDKNIEKLAGEKEAEKLVKKLADSRAALKLMKRIMHGFRGRLDDELRPLGITTAQLLVLHAVRTESRASGAQLARELQVTPQSAQAIIERAEKNGWITRSRDPHNDRLRISHLTPVGEALLETASTLSEQIHQHIWQDVRRSDLRELIETLESAAKRLESA